MALDPKQACAATTFGISQAVIAGAGSGKTLTMKERVAEAFRAREADEINEAGAVLKAHDRMVDHIGEVLAITFTEAAAAELKDRVKGVLREADDPAVQSQALLVDDAWISTIHGMCSRLLRENAFTLGVDPEYTIVMDTQRDQLLATAIDDAITASAVGNALSFEYASHGDFGTNLHDMIAELIYAAVKSPELFDSFVLPPQGDPSQILRYLYQALANDPKADIARMKEEGFAGKTSTKGLNIKGDAEALLEIERLLAQDTVALEDALAVCRMVEFVSTLGDADKLPVFGNWSGPWAQFGPFNRRSAVSLCVLSLVLMQTNDALESMLEIAADAYARFQEEKRSRGLMDYDDLLLFAYRALQDEGIAALYRDKFKLVIVDEFQDTNQLQLDIIRHFTGPEDCRLCVVGDRMQSIYRFQGADVSVCNGHLDRSARETMSIDNNYRSHEKIISFVDTAFDGQGSEYLKLVAARKERPAGVRYLPFDEEREGPRVSVLELQYASGCSKDDARQLAAYAIAQRFKQMHQGEAGKDGRSYGEMVILLSAMTYADTYAAALRAEGIPCAIVKGSVMKNAYEARMLLNALAFLADPADTKALFTVLEGPLFGLSDKDLIDLALPAPQESADDGADTSANGKVYRNLSGRFDSYLALRESGKDEAAALVGLSARAAHAVRVLGEARLRLFALPVSVVLNYVVVASGLLERLNSAEGVSRAEGQTVGANLLKMVRLVREMEEDGTTGAAALAAQLDAHITEVGDTPGALATGEGDFVRIMTIHASKGLSFPVVALSELKMNNSRSKLSIQASQGKTYVALEGGASLSGRKDCASESVSNLAAGLIDTANGFGPADLARAVDNAQEQAAPGVFFAAVDAFAYTQEKAELERKIYVGMTRPEEALITVSFNNIFAAELNAAFEDGPLAQLAADAGLKAIEAKKFFNVNGLDGSLSGCLGQLHARRSAVLAAGGGYQVITPVWLQTWKQTGMLPPVLCGAEGTAPDLDGFDVRTIEFAQETDQQDSQAAAADEEAFAIYPDASLDAPRIFGYANNWASGVMSASSIKTAGASCITEESAGSISVFAEEDELIEDAPVRVDSIARGLAFHALAEWAVRHAAPGAPCVKPPQERIDAICAFNGLDDHDRADLDQMLEAWFASAVSQDMASFEHRRAEVPFFIDLTREDGSPACLNGFIDLLAYDGDTTGAHAQVVDYKTGTSLTTDEQRHAAYEVQAQVYAYALLRQGFDAVSLRFVFVEQDTGASENAAAPGGDASAALPVTYFPEEGGAYTSADDLRVSLLERLDSIVLDQ